MVLSYSHGQEEGRRIEALRGLQKIEQRHSSRQVYPLPNIADFTSCIAGSTVFLRLDLQKGYYQIPMASEAIGGKYNFC